MSLNPNQVSVMYTALFMYDLFIKCMTGSQSNKVLVMVSDVFSTWCHTCFLHGFRSDLRIPSTSFAIISKKDDG